METAEFTSREALVAELVEARRNGVEVDVIGSGLTLRYPNGRGAAAVEELVEVKAGPRQGGRKKPAQAPAEEPVTEPVVDTAEEVPAAEPDSEELL